jgi:TDG/mug DNA glycosylase family protein
MNSTSANQTILSDLLAPNLKIVFCGTAAGHKSAKLNAYYAGPGNSFYPTLSKLGFIDNSMKPNEYNKLLDYGIGLTDLVKYAHGADKDLKASDYNIEIFKEKIRTHQPRIICFNGKQAAKVLLGLKKTSQVDYGLQSVMIGSSKLFVAPSTSAQARKYWNEDYWRILKEMI